MNDFTWFYLEVLIVLELACFVTVWLGWGLDESISNVMSTHSFAVSRVMPISLLLAALAARTHIEDDLL